MRIGTMLCVMGLLASCSSKSGVEGSSCPNDNNCISPLKCINNVCINLNPEDAGFEDVGLPEDTGVAPDTGVDAGPPDTGVPDYEDQFASGPFQSTPDGDTLGYQALAGRVGLIRETTGYTSVLLHVSGLNPSLDYPTHVHTKRCNDEGGGPHYKIDEGIADPIESNEIWPSLTSDPQGDGHGYVRVNHYARDDAFSVVIHEPVTLERIACANILGNATVTANGDFIELTAGQGSGITGTASLRRFSGGTEVTAEINGALTADAEYPVHVHAARCDDNEGGPHYKIDQDVQDTVPTNEIWPNITADNAGATGSGSANTPHIARHDAWSVVVHDPVTNDRLLCADLVW